MKKETISLKIILLLIIIPALLGILFNMFSDSGISFIRAEKTYIYEDDLNIDQILVNEEAQVSDIKLISLDQAFKLFSAKEAIFIDARDKWDFAEGHINGAVNIPEYNFNPQSEKVTSLDRERLYIIYCNDDDCETSQRLADELQKLEFTKIYIFEEGWNSWLIAHYPTEQSELE